jgi:hypothetical protein
MSVDESLICSSSRRSVGDMNPRLNRKRIAMVIAGAAVVTAGDLGQAEKAALEETGGGKVTESDGADDESGSDTD